MISGKFGVDKIIHSRHYTSQDAMDKNAIQEVENQITISLELTRKQDRLLMKVFAMKKKSRLKN